MSFVARGFSVNSIKFTFFSSGITFQKNKRTGGTDLCF